MLIPAGCRHPVQCDGKVPRRSSKDPPFEGSGIHYAATVGVVVVDSATPLTRDSPLDNGGLPDLCRARQVT